MVPARLLHLDRRMQKLTNTDVESPALAETATGFGEDLIQAKCLLEQDTVNNLSGPLWIASALLAMTWTSGTQAFLDQARRAPPDWQHARVLATRVPAKSGGSAVNQDQDKPHPKPESRHELARMAQATTSDTGRLKPSIGQQHQPADALECELSVAKRDIDLLQHIEQAHNRTEQLEQDLLAARRDVQSQTTLAREATEKADRAGQLAERGTAELQKTLQQLQQEREFANELKSDLAIARREIGEQTALVAKRSDEISGLRQESESGAAELRESLQRERERARRLEQDLAVARRDLETQVGLTAKASEHAFPLKQAPGGLTELSQSMQMEQERAQALEQELSKARSKIYAYETQSCNAGARVAEPSQATAVAPALRSPIQEEPDRAKQLEEELHKEHERANALAEELSVARTKLYAYEAQASRKASETAIQLDQAVEADMGELRRSLQQERDRAAHLEKDLATARSNVDAQTELVSKATEDTTQTKQKAARETDDLGSSLQKERTRAERLESDLALTRNTSLPDKTELSAAKIAIVGGVEPQRRVEPYGKIIAEGATPASARGDAQPNSEEANQSARLLARANVLLGQGDIGAGRTVLERAVEMGSAQATFALAETYDPSILSKWGTYGTRADTVKARDLYAKADAKGIKEARARIEALLR